MKTKSDTAMEWIAEADYCARVANGEETLQNFNYDRACFARYVRAKAEKADREGYTAIADDLYALVANYVGAEGR